MINGVICITMIVFWGPRSVGPSKNWGVSSLGLCIRLEKNRVLVSILLMVSDTVSLSF